LADDLHRFLADEPIRARPVGLGERAWRWCRRNPGLAGLTAAVQFALLCLLGLAVWANVRIDRALGEAEVRRREAETARSGAETARAQAETARGEAVKLRDAAVGEAYRARFSEARALRLARQAGWRHEALRHLGDLAGAATPVRDLAALRGEAVVCLGDFDA